MRLSAQLRVRTLASLTVFSASLAATGLRAQSADLSGVEISRRYRVESLKYPDTPLGAINLAVAPNGVAVVPVGGGLFLAGFNGWLVNPSKDTIYSASYDGTGALLTASRSASGMIEILRTTPGRKTERIATLPSGFYQIADAGEMQAIVSGRMLSGDWAAWIVAPSQPPRQLIRTKERIPAATALNKGTVILAIGPRVVLARRGEKPVLLARATRPIDGLAVDANGALYVSNDQGVFRSDSVGTMTLVARGIHGPLVARAGALYVLSRARNRVLVLRPASQG